ncbi:Sec-independent protein translocase subunit TatA [Streptomyces kebangsaanensis]|uniref:Sec-independent protein translocase subunit TatA n=1 Tax=Streptomyces kebangsaanensis TaxID=864058 RepID=UPI00093C97C8|nr:Sec-independent protein translocase subunit TatA [Streptomyces kebangsaanensis]
MLRNALEPWHLLIVAIVIIVLFGSKKLPEAARGLGKAMRILKSEAAAMKEDDAMKEGGAMKGGGAARHPAAPAERATAPEPAARVVRAAPGETATARPAAGSHPAR